MARPRFRLPLWAALALLGAAYLLRSLVINAGDFSFDLPGDAISLVTVLVAYGLVTWLRRSEARDETEDQSSEKRQGKDGGPDGSG